MKSVSYTHLDVYKRQPIYSKYNFGTYGYDYDCAQPESVPSGRCGFCRIPCKRLSLIHISYYHETHEELQGYDIKPVNPLFFIIPLGLAITITLVLNDILIGMTCGALSCLVLYLPFKVMKPGRFFDACWKGFESMVIVTAIVISAFVLQLSLIHI